MMRAAENQGYRPVWGRLRHAPGVLPGLNAPVEQMRNVIGVGWLPTNDVDASVRETVKSETTVLCDQILRDAGQPEGIGYPQCELLFFLRSAFERATEVSSAGLAGGAAALGDSYRSAYTIRGRTGFGVGDHSGPSIARLVRYDDEVGVFTYASDEIPLS